jgi:hypothetical protein
VQSSLVAKASIREDNESDAIIEIIILHPLPYEPIGPASDGYSSLVAIQWILYMEKLHLYWQVVKPMLMPFALGKNPKK